MIETAEAVQATETAPEAIQGPPGVISSGKRPGAWRMLIYGTPGVGKSTLATYAPKPFFLDLEDGLKWIDCEKTEEVLRSWEEVEGWLKWLYTSEHTTIVIDTVDELEAMLSRKLCSEHNKSSIDDFGYGKGQTLLALEWRKVIDILTRFSRAGKNIILVGHEKIEKLEDPTSENYDRFQLNVHKKTAPIITAKMDAVLFARGEVLLHERKGSIEKKRATGTGSRVLHCLEAPCWVAKNRFGLPERMEMSPKLFDLIKGE